jgi:GT2 family glycosyltransferase
MPTIVTAVVVSQGGGDIERTLDALAGQTRRVERIIAVHPAGRSLSGDSASRVSQVVAAGDRASFGAAVAAGLASVPHPSRDSRMLGTSARTAMSGGETAVADPTMAAEVEVANDEFYWLLDGDSTPGPNALEALLAAMEVSPSVGAAGPKLVDADNPERLRGLGETLTSLGASVALMTGGPAGAGNLGGTGDFSAGELDQGQHDHNSDVMGVSAHGMLVRAALWWRCGGFDPALTAVDDGLDLCIRARLCGYRIVVVPDARVAIAPAARKRAWHRSRQRHRRHRRRRQAQLHRRLVYAPAVLAPLHWLSLVPLGLARSILWLVCKRPGFIVAELSATFAAAFSWGRIFSARRRLRRERIAGFAVIAPLRLRPADTRRMRAMAREAARARGDGVDQVLFSEAGFWAIVAAAIAGVIVAIPILGRQSLSGGGLLPLGSFDALWSTAARSPDPFPLVLAALGTVTFWHPSLVMAALWVAALPLSALGAWFAATTLTRRAGLRAAIALAWAFAPPAFSALFDGRSAGLLFHLLLPWLVVAGARVPRSWAASGATAILSAAALACAPSTWPLFALVWLAGLGLAGRRMARVLPVPLPALALFAPAVWRAWPDLARVFADPGVPVVTPPAAPWHLLTGLPATSFSHLQQSVGDLLGGIGVGVPGVAATSSLVIALALFALPALLALTGTFMRDAARTALWIGLALAAAALAVTASRVEWSALGAQPVSLDTGPALSVYWLALLAAGVIGLDVVARAAVTRRIKRHPATRRRGAAPGIAILTWAAVVSIAIASLPVAAALAEGHGSVTAAGKHALPAVVAAGASTNPQVGTLRLTAQPDGGIDATVIRGSGQRLESVSSARLDRPLARLVGDLASRGQTDTTSELTGRGIGFVLVAPAARRPGQPVTAQAEATYARVVSDLNGNAGVAAVTTGTSSRLYSVDAGHVRAAPARPAPVHTLTLLALAVVFGFFLLLALPTAPPSPSGSRGRRTARGPSGRRRLRPERSGGAPRRGRGEADAAWAKGTSGSDADPDARGAAGDQGVAPPSTETIAAIRVPAEIGDGYDAPWEEDADGE